MSEEVKRRLKKYLRRDDTRIRKTVLSYLLEKEKCTTKEVYEFLRKNKFDINERGVCAMLGLMNVRLGILGVELRKSSNQYFLKDKYREVLKSVLDNF